MNGLVRFIRPLIKMMHRLVSAISNQFGASPQPVSIVDLLVAIGLCATGVALWEIPWAGLFGSWSSVALSGLIAMSCLAWILLGLRSQFKEWVKRRPIKEWSLALLLPACMSFLAGVALTSQVAASIANPFSLASGVDASASLLFTLELPRVLPLASTVYCLRRRYWFGGALSVAIYVMTLIWFEVPSDVQQALPFIRPYGALDLLAILLVAIWAFLVPPKIPLRKLPKDVLLAFTLLIGGIYIVFLDNQPTYRPLPTDAANYFATSLSGAKTTLTIDTQRDEAWAASMEISGIDQSYIRSQEDRAEFSITLPTALEHLSIHAGSSDISTISDTEVTDQCSRDYFVSRSFTEDEYYCLLAPGQPVRNLTVAFTFHPVGDRVGLGRSRFVLQSAGKHGPVTNGRSPDIDIILNPDRFRVVDVAPSPTFQTPDELFWKSRTGRSEEISSSFTLESRRMRLLADQGANILALGSGALLASFAAHAGRAKDTGRP